MPIKLIVFIFELIKLNNNIDVECNYFQPLLDHEYREGCTRQRSTPQHTHLENRTHRLYTVHNAIAVIAERRLASFIFQYF